jgi:hypothetical protein
VKEIGSDLSIPAAKVPSGSLLSCRFECGHDDLFVHGGDSFLPPYREKAGWKTLFLWEHADLLRLKAAVEKAMEVTPQKTAWRICCYASVGAVEGSGGKGKSRVTVTNNAGAGFLEFPTQALAEEYVAWKNSQESK